MTSDEREGEPEERASGSAEGGRPPLPEIDFGTFVLSLGHSALCHLGEAPHPETGKPDRNLALAKQTVDILAMLQEKTRGNLDEEEARLLEQLLYELRLKYVEATRR